MTDEERSEPARRSEIKTVFFSYHFEKDEPFVRAVTQCIERQGLEMMTGVRLGGGDVPSVVRDRIRSADSLIALLTRRYRIGEPEMQLWDTYPWVRDELTIGYQLDKPTIAIVERGVEVAGAFSNYEQIIFDRDHWDAAIDKLEETLLLWTGKLGARPIKVRLSPEKFVREVERNARLQCRYRWWSPPGDPEKWSSADILFLAGGAFFLAHRPPDESALIEVQLLADGEPQFHSRWTGMEVLIALFQADE